MNLIVNNIVTEWFGEGFKKLDPLLQELHTNGGMLAGPVSLKYGQGVAGHLGEKIGKKLGLPVKAGNYDFEVNITHRNEQLIWKRNFGDKYSMTSVFVPIGRYPNGYWKETTGMVSLELGVDVLQGGWYWVHKSVKLRGVEMPMFMFPKSNAYKRISNGKYEFSVTLTLPILGMLLSYSGLLDKS